jgi:hypothetical protein
LSLLLLEKITNELGKKCASAVIREFPELEDVIYAQKIEAEGEWMRKPPPLHTRFKPGKSGNPSGRKPLPDPLRGVAKLTSDELSRTISLYFRMDINDLKEAIDNPKTTTLDLLIATTIALAIKNGDIQKAEYLFLRSLGRVTEKIEIQHPEPVAIQRLSGEILSLEVKEIE